ncbi:MAG: SCO family protein [Verrucomicrobiales bacterium]|nr:SCO family protein [Verrucomicrobiales bacterium]MCP5525980.1 SCO family protein [Verrucomicrobiales bacterium]
MFWATGPVFLPAAEPSGTRTFEVKGEVRRLVPEGNVLVIKHEEIPGYMDAMTMPFQVKNPAEMAGIGIGDKLVFRMTVTEDDGWIDRIRVLERGGAEDPKPDIPGIRLVRDVDPLKVGDRMPSYPFTNELHQAVSLDRFKGQVVALTFIYTRCPYPTFCPRQCRQFAEALTLLKQRLPGPERRWHLLSLSFDPAYDTPSVLQEYARRYDYNPAHWNFLTGAMIDIDAITEQFGVIFARDGEGWSHNVRTVVIDAAGMIRKIYVGNEWTAEELVEAMVQAAAGGAEADRGRDGGVSAPPASEP